MTDEDLACIYERVRPIHVRQTPAATWLDTCLVIAELAAVPLRRVHDACIELDD